MRKKTDGTYYDRRKWQDEARARGETPECGREACRHFANPAWVNAHTPLLYCERCAASINRYNPGFCSRELELCSGPVGITAFEARDYATRIYQGEAPIPLLVHGEPVGVMALYPIALHLGGPSNGWQLCLDDSAHGRVRLAVFGANALH